MKRELSRQYVRIGELDAEPALCPRDFRTAVGGLHLGGILGTHRGKSVHQSMSRELLDRCLLDL